ncbi:MAG: GNAT family N-acetyltransferase [Gammaproteobacteria bacterium]|nr:GNAT family N-acetyltransferase [Gammaproteobacteria bacterium]
MEVRRAQPADLPQLLALVRRYWDFERIAGFDALRLEILLQRLLREPALGEIWVAPASPGLAGYLVAMRVFSLEHQGLMAEVDEFFVEPAQRARGVGAALLAAAERSLAAGGCVRLQLQLGTGNAHGERFYRSRGYAPREGYRLFDKPLR